MKRWFLFSRNLAYLFGLKLIYFVLPFQCTRHRQQLVHDAPEGAPLDAEIGLSLGAGDVPVVKESNKTNVRNVIGIAFCCQVD
jgi:hypothetical protein